MEMNNREKAMMEQIEEAKATAATYFEKTGLTSAFNAYFDSEAVKAQINEAYEKMAERVQVLADSVPKYKQEKAKRVAAQLVSGKNEFCDAAKTNMMIQIMTILVNMEDIVLMDALAGAPFKKAFEDETDGTLQLAMSKNLDEMIENAVSTFMDMAMGPAFSVMNLIGDILGMSQDDMLDILRREDDDSDDDDDPEEAEDGSNNEEESDD